MAMSNGDVLWQRGLDEDSDWDDTALIEAYDKSVSLLKSQLAKRKSKTCQNTESTSHTTGTEPTREGAGSSTPETGARDKKKRGWIAGDFCRAVYSQDGVQYEAKIKYITGDTCVVHYIGYGNEEEVKLSDLLPSFGKKTRKRQQQHAEDEAKFNAERYAHTTVVGTPPPTSEISNQSFAQDGSSSRKMNVPAMDTTGTGGGSSIFPAFPPPPPPLPVGDPADEALSSMLISWYMSGYHTGYYQAVRQIQNKSSSNASGSG